MAIVNISQHASLRPTLGNEGKWFLQGIKDFTVQLAEMIYK